MTVLVDSQVSDRCPWATCFFNFHVKTKMMPLHTVKSSAKWRGEAQRESGAKVALSGIE